MCLNGEFVKNGKYSKLESLRQSNQNEEILHKLRISFY